MSINLFFNAIKRAIVNNIVNIDYLCYTIAMLNPNEGLSSSNAQELLKQYGPNESVKNNNSAFKILIKQNSH